MKAASPILAIAVLCLTHAADAPDPSAIIVTGSSVSSPTVRLLEDVVRDRGLWPLTRSELEEILKAMTTLANESSHNMVVAEEAMYLTEAARHRLIADRIEKREKDRAWALAVMEKWRERGRKLSP